MIAALIAELKAAYRQMPEGMHGNTTKRLPLRSRSTPARGSPNLTSRSGRENSPSGRAKADQQLLPWHWSVSQITPSCFICEKTSTTPHVSAIRPLANRKMKISSYVTDLPVGGTPMYSP